MSEEHVWPVWMHPYLPKLENPNTEERHITIRGARVIRNAIKKERQGQTYTRTFKGICKHCNETWMSGIEDDVKPLMLTYLGRKTTHPTEE